MEKIVCSTCNGVGYLSIMPGTTRGMRLCPFCNGTGNYINNKKESEEIKRYDGVKWVDHQLTADEYQRLAARTINQELLPYENKNHALFGMVGEIGEIHSIYQKFYQGHTVDLTHAKKEVGDLLWFIAEFCTAHGWMLSDVMAENISKLEARYPEGFEEGKSLNRKDGDI